MPRLIFPVLLVALSVAAATSASALDYTSRAVAVNPTTGAVTLADGSVLYLARAAVPMQVGERVTVFYGSPDPMNMERDRFFP